MLLLLDFSREKRIQITKLIKLHVCTKDFNASLGISDEEKHGRRLDKNKARTLITKIILTNTFMP